MKLSFSKPKSSSSKPPKPSQTFLDESISNNNQPNPEFLTEFDPSKTLNSSSNKKPPIIIPPKENEWRPYKKMKNIDLPSIKSADGKPLEFEIENEEIANKNPDETMSYGLNLRENSGNGGNLSSNSVDAILLKKLRRDLEDLPEDEGFEQFEEVPVEGFGAALLGGYGWYEGRGIGKNAKEDVKVPEYKRWTAKEGLGFHDAKVEDEKRDKKKRESSSRVPDHGSKDAKFEGKEGSNKNRESSRFSDHGSKGTKVEDKQGSNESRESFSRFNVGMEVRVVSGREMGLKGRVLEVVSGGKSLILRLVKGGEDVEVGVNQVAKLGSEEEEKCLRKLKELKIQSKKDDDGKKSDRKSKESSRDRKESKRDERKGKKVSWLRSHIRVRVISKEFKGGRFYLKKGEVVDVVGPTTCDISMDDGREIVQGVDQDILETALPRRGGPVLVLSGKHKGVYGSLVEKDSERETGVVEDADTKELLNVRLEQIAEYIGDPSYLGY